MKARDLLLSFLVLTGCATAPAPSTDFRFIRGSFAPDRQPDGNSVMLQTASGFAVVDTGRHRSHAEKIIAEAIAGDAPVIAIFNTHWHLDHISGNIALREAFPGAAVYSNQPALTDALSDFLVRGAEANRRRLADATLETGQREDARTDLATVEAGARLHPTQSIEASQAITIGGRRLEVHVAQAATSGDLWLYDPASRLLIAGDLITLPAPFLDTACPKNWRAGLDALLAIPFEQLAPGHGRLMSRTDVTLYRDAFGALLDCAAGAAPPRSCADQWANAAAPLLDESSGDIGQANVYARYYVENVLRQPEGKPTWCQG